MQWIKEGITEVDLMLNEAEALVSLLVQTPSKALGRDLAMYSHAYMVL